MLRVLCSRRWLGWHALLIVGVVVMILLGRWQWHRAQSATGTLQNLGYAFQWWFFGCLAVFGWAREVRADVRSGRGGGPEQQLAAEAALTEGLTEGLGLVPASTASAASTAPAVPEEADEELAAYNAYLVRLNARDQRLR